MKIIVFPHELSIGGSQINAIDLAAAVAAKGHEVLIYGTDGPLVGDIAERGLKFVKAHHFKYRPAPPKIIQLMRLAREEKADLIHTYEWPPCLDAYLGAGLFGHVPVIATILDMVLSPFIPPSLPLIMGTAELTEQARARRPGPVWSLEPPIDTIRDHPGIDGTPFRRQLSLSDADLLVVTVSRLAIDLKLDALVRSIDAIDHLAARYPIRLALVGGGPAGDALRSRANAVNARHRREVISLVGEAGDPRSAYAAADIVLGMGSSALRALSIGRPLIVQGEEGFSRVFEPESAALFLHQGFYGLDSGQEGPEILAAQIERLLLDKPLRDGLGRMGRSVVEANFSLDALSNRLLGIYETVSHEKAPFIPGEVASVLGKALQRELQNHEPRRKRDRKTLESLKLRSAASGPWPPANLDMAME